MTHTTSFKGTLLLWDYWYPVLYFWHAPRWCLFSFVLFVYHWISGTGFELKFVLKWSLLGKEHYGRGIPYFITCLWQIPQNHFWVRHLPIILFLTLCCNKMYDDEKIFLWIKCRCHSRCLLCTWQQLFVRFNCINKYLFGTRSFLFESVTTLTGF